MLLRGQALEITPFGAAALRAGRTQGEHQFCIQSELSAQRPRAVGFCLWQGSGGSTVVCHGPSCTGQAQGSQAKAAPCASTALLRGKPGCRQGQRCHQPSPWAAGLHRRGSAAGSSRARPRAHREAQRGEQELLPVQERALGRRSFSRHGDYVMLRPWALSQPMEELHRAGGQQPRAERQRSGGVANTLLRALQNP